MKRLLIIWIVILIVVLIVLGGIAFFLKPFHGSTGPVATTTNPFANNGVQGGQLDPNTPKINIQTTDGQTVTVPDFTQNKPKLQEQSGTYYYVTQDQQGNEINPDFSIVYGSDSTIAIGLLNEPLGQSRAHAEQALEKLIPLTGKQLCALNISVMTSPSVNDQFAGENLGLSFCPGAVKLP